MGQYWIPVNLDKKEFIHPHDLGAGLKLWEQLANHPGTAAALILLQAAMPDPRGGGDLNPNDVVGRWAGDRVVLVGDYGEKGDIPGKPELDAGKIYMQCQPEAYRDPGDGITEYYTDISEMVCEVIANELGGYYEGDGWRTSKRGRPND